MQKLIHCSVYEFFFILKMYNKHHYPFKENVIECTVILYHMRPVLIYSPTQNHYKITSYIKHYNTHQKT